MAMSLQVMGRLTPEDVRPVLPTILPRFLNSSVSVVLLIQGNLVPFVPNLYELMRDVLTVVMNILLAQAPGPSANEFQLPSGVYKVDI